MGEVEDVIETVRAVATEGLSYATDKYDRARYQKLLDLISKTVAEKLSLPSIDVLRLLLSHWGCITP
ncbi:MAG: NUDIX hydrolase N-terminal domain-containing protein, partial [Paracoccaceae bacterium]